jgi:hypothetical protein
LGKLWRHRKDDAPQKALASLAIPPRAPGSQSLDPLAAVTIFIRRSILAGPVRESQSRTVARSRPMSPIDLDMC